MIHSFPVIARELRLRARAPATYWLRAGVALVGTAIASVLILFSGMNFAPGALGGALFRTLATIMWVFCLVEGVRLTVDGIAAEKREGTIGLLFLTDLKGIDVVFGKLVAVTVLSFQAVLAVVPALAIPLLLGGITSGQFWRMTLVLGNTLFLSATLGTLTSASSANERTSWGRATLLLLLLAGVLPILAWQTTGPLRWWSEHLSPWTPFQQALNPAFDPLTFWVSLGMNHLLGWGCLISAGIILQHTWQQRIDPPRRSQTIARTPKSLAVWKKRLAKNPILAQATQRLDRERRQSWGLLLAMVLLAVVLESFSSIPGLVGILLGVGLHVVFILRITSAATFLTAGQQASGELELLLTTPLTIPQIVRGQRLALFRAFGEPLLALTVLEIAILIPHLVMGGTIPGNGWGYFGMLGGWVSLLILVSDAAAVGLVGLWFGLQSGKPTKAFFKTILIVEVAPMIAASMCCFLSPILLLVKNVLFISWAVAGTHQHFRKAVAGSE